MGHQPSQIPWRPKTSCVNAEWGTGSIGEIPVETGADSQKQKVKPNDLTFLVLS
jgi:hypothetical protein